MNKKEDFELKVQEAVIEMADYMLSHADENNILPMSGTQLRKKMNYNIYVYNEVSGTLKALGFHSGPTNFTKTELFENGYNKHDSNYCFRIKPEFHPNKISNELAFEKLKKRQKKLEYNRELEMSAISMVLENMDKFEDVSYEPHFDYED